MLRLTFLLCSALFLTLLIGGRDYGQMRPGLAAAAISPATPPQPIIQPVEMVSLETKPAALASVVEAASIPIVIEPAPTPVIQPVAVEETAPILYVTAEQVNVRSGPSTDYAVVGKLDRGEAALLVGTDEAGWAPIRIEGDGVEGYVSSKYLSSIAPY